MKAYLDSNVNSAIAKKDFPREILALKQLMDSFDAGMLDLRTSKVAHTEIERYAGMKKSEMKELYHRLEKVPFVEDHELLGFHSQWDRYGGVSYPLIKDDAMSSPQDGLGATRRSSPDVGNSCPVRRVSHLRRKNDSQPTCRDRG